MRSKSSDAKRGESSALDQTEDSGVLRSLTPQMIKNIEPTSLVTCHAKTFSGGIPHAKRVGELLHAERAEESEFMRLTDRATMILGVIVRHRSLVNLLKAYLPGDVLEIAAGQTPMGLNLASMRGRTEYVGTDISPNSTNIMPAVFDTIVQESMGSIALHGSYRFTNADARDIYQLEKALSLLRREGPLRIIHEGFMPFLPGDDREKYLENIRKIMRHNPDTRWITTDPSITRDEMKTFFGNDYERSRIIMQDILKFDIYENLLPDLKAAERFYSKEGFRFLKYPLATSVIQEEIAHFKRIEPDTNTSVAESNMSGFVQMNTAWVLRLRG